MLPFYADSCGAAIENDHIAFRTMGVPHLGIASFEKIFLHYGYQKRDPYFFESKKLDAFWFSPPEPHFPRIFVSELRVGFAPRVGHWSLPASNLCAENRGGTLGKGQDRG